MKEDDNIVASFQHVDEITNTLEGLGEPIDEKTITQKIVRMLPRRFNPKVLVLEYSENLAKLRKEELHGVLIAYEMRLDEEEAQCPNKSDGNSKGKKGFKFNKQGKKKAFKKNFLSKEDSSSSNEESDSEEEANERVLFMAKHNKQEVSNNKEEGLTIEIFSKEAIKLIKELKAEKISSNMLE
eukprot:PITA_30968